MLAPRSALRQSSAVSKDLTVVVHRGVQGGFAVRARAGRYRDPDAFVAALKAGRTDLHHLSAACFP